MLRDWYQPECNTVWPESKVFGKLLNLKLAPEQQSLVDSSIQMDQWVLGKSQAAQPFNDLKMHLIFSVNMHRQASTILLANTDHMADHCFAIDQALATAHKGAFLPRRERDLYPLDPAPVLYGDIDPNYTGLLFPDSGLETPDLESIMGDSVQEDIKGRVLLAVKESHAKNCERVQNLDSIVRSLCS